jgi:serine/threonine protein kinase
MAPEIRFITKGVRISEKADIWSVACVIFYLCTGYEAFVNFRKVSLKTQ